MDFSYYNLYLREVCHPVNVTFKMASDIDAKLKEFNTLIKIICAYLDEIDAHLRQKLREFLEKYEIHLFSDMGII
jgi:hypothetical protein